MDRLNPDIRQLFLRGIHEPLGGPGLLSLLVSWRQFRTPTRGTVDRLLHDVPPVHRSPGNPNRGFDGDNIRVRRRSSVDIFLEKNRAFNGDCCYWSQFR